MSAVAVIQARMGSARLQGKVLLPLAGRSVLAWVIRAAAAAANVERVVVATTSEPGDDAIVAECERLGTSVVRGEVEDVLSRFVVAFERFPGDPIVRLTADCPLLDPKLIEEAIILQRTTGADFVATDLVMHLPRGTDVEVMSPAALRWADEHATGIDRVHVTSAIYSNPYLFHLEPLRRAMTAGDFRVTIDTQPDYEAVQAIVDALGDRPPSVEELVELLAARPDIVSINREIRQKAIDEG